MKIAKLYEISKLLSVYILIGNPPNDRGMGGVGMVPPTSKRGPMSQSMPI